MNKIYRNNILKEKGYIKIHPAFTNKEFDLIKKAIDQQYKEVISNKNIPINLLENHFSYEFKVGNYHKISHLINHEDSWPKISRVLPQNFAKWFLSTSYIEKLREIYGKITITDEEFLGYPNIYWRIVRPNISRDVGAFHRDAWFWEIDKLQGKNFTPYKRLKSWIGINVEPGKNGLIVIPGSHKEDKIEWEAYTKDGKLKPKLLSPIDQKEKILLKTQNNTVILFDDKLIHGGSVNNGLSTRVSLEFTIFLENA